MNTISGWINDSRSDDQTRMLVGAKQKLETNFLNTLFWVNFEQIEQIGHRGNAKRRKSTFLDRRRTPERFRGTVSGTVLGALRAAIRP